MTDERKEQIRDQLLHDGANFTLVMKMTERELETAANIKEWDDYNDYLDNLCGKYNI